MFYTHTLLNPFIAGCVFATVAIQVNALEKRVEEQSKYIADINMLLPNHSDLIKDIADVGTRFAPVAEAGRGRRRTNHGSRDSR
jgi:hypothetical protein